MPRKSRHPIILDDLLSFSASSIVQKSKEDSSLLLRWYTNGELTAGIHCEVEKQKDTLVAHFKYHTQNDPTHLSVKITTTASNLGIGRIPFFVCPISGKRCRKLFLIQGHLISGSAIKEALYDTQTRSKKYRTLLPLFERPFQLEKLQKQIHSPYFKPMYRSKPTRTLRHIAEKIANLQQCSSRVILREILGERIR